MRRSIGTSTTRVMTDEDGGPFGPLYDLDDLDLMAVSRVLLDLSSAAKRLRVHPTSPIN